MWLRLGLLQSLLPGTEASPRREQHTSLGAMFGPSLIADVVITDVVITDVVITDVVITVWAVTSPFVWV